MSFGTGQHATTKFCLSAIDRFSAELTAEGEPFSLLDAGSGSGILFIAACKLGAMKADAFDIDPDTIPVARENALLNHIPEEKFSLRACSLLEFPAEKQYEIVAYLDNRCEKIDSIIEEKQGLITDLESYKRSLIYEVVTGKRKVV